MSEKTIDDYPPWIQAAALEVDDLVGTLSNTPTEFAEIIARHYEVAALPAEREDGE